jgi:CRISPR-associated protein Cas1
MTRIILDRRGICLEYATNCLIVRASGEVPRSIPLSKLEQIFCMHNVQLTTQLIGQLHSRKIDLIVLNQRYEHLSYALFADQRKIVERRCKQYLWQQQAELRVPVAVQICQHKFRNMQRSIRACSPQHALIEKLDQANQDMNEWTGSEDQLRGIEGNLQRELFAFWRGMLPAGLGFKSRLRRPPPDPVNALLSLTYSLIHSDSVRQAIRYGLDSQLGFYHRTAFGRHSLACDLMEPIRPSVEHWVVELFQSHTLDKRYFTSSGSGCQLGKKGRYIFYKAFEEQRETWTRGAGSAARWLQRLLDKAA